MEDWKKTVCILCECNCGVEVRLEDRKIITRLFKQLDR